MQTETTSAFQIISTPLLLESSLNPRKRFRGLEDLAGSIRTHGILTPLLVRPRPSDHFEIAAGHRRYRAALLAGLTEVPVIARQMTDEQFMEVLTVENLQREDVHPYEEGQGYAELLKLPGYDVAAVAAKISRSESYVRSRLALLNLELEVADAFLSDRITFAHARLIAPLPKGKQAEALAQCFERWGDKRHLVSASDLKDWIHAGDGETLSDAPFDLADATLVPAAGACLTCPKSTCGEGKLFADDDGEETCFDKKCFEAKVDAKIRACVAAGLVQISTSWHEKETPASALRKSEFTQIDVPEDPATDDLEPHEKPCEFVQRAVVVHGADRGSVVTICCDVDCPVHGEKIAEKEAAPAGGKAPAERPSRLVDAEQQAKALKQKDEWARRERVFNRLCSEWTPALDPNLAMVLIANELRNMYSEADFKEFASVTGVELSGDVQAMKAQVYVWAEKTTPAFRRTALLWMMLRDEVQRHEWNRNYDLLAIAEAALEKYDPKPVKAKKGAR